MTSAASLLLVVGEPFSLDQKELILQRIEKGLKSLSDSIAGCDVNAELERIAAEGLPGEDGPNGERVIRSTSPDLSTDIIFNPQLWTVQAHLRDFLISGAKHRHVVYSGQVLQGCGSWVLQDDTFTFSNMAGILREADVENSLKQQEGSSLHFHAFADGNWSAANLQKIIPKNVTVEFNPNEQLEKEQGVTNLSAYLGNIMSVKTPKDLLLSSDVVGNIRFNRPTLYVFPGCNGDSALFGINGFNLLVNGGYNRKACFWDFTRHLDRIDAMLITHLGSDNIFGLSTVMDRKVTENVHPEIGYVYMNGVEKKKHSPNGDTHPENGGLHKQGSLVVNLAEEGHRVIENLHLLGQAPGSCIGSMQGKEFKPVNLYHKVGHGTLDMYVLNPMQDSKELKEFYTQWNKNVNSFSSKGGISLPNMMSVCALLVWKPANVNEKITRLLFPGNSPQSKIFEGLDKLKTMNIFQHSSCSELSLNAPKLVKKAAGTKSASAPASAKPPPIKRTPPPPSAPKAEPKKATTPPAEKKSPVKAVAPTKTNKDAKNKKAGAASKPTGKKSPPSASPSSVESKSPVEPAKPVVPAPPIKVDASPVPDVPEIKAEEPVVEKPVDSPPEPAQAWESEARPKTPETAPVSEEPPKLVDIPPVETAPPMPSPKEEAPPAEPVVPEPEQAPQAEEPAPVPSPLEPQPPQALAEEQKDEPAEESVPEPSPQSEKVEADQAIPSPAAEVPQSLPDPIFDHVAAPEEQQPAPVEADTEPKMSAPVEEPVAQEVAATQEASPLQESAPEQQTASVEAPPQEPDLASFEPEPVPSPEQENVEADQLLQNIEDDPPMGVPDPLPDPDQFDSATYAAFSQGHGMVDEILEPMKEPAAVELPVAEPEDEPHAEKDLTPTSDVQSDVMEEEVAKEAEPVAEVVEDIPRNDVREETEQTAAGDSAPESEPETVEDKSETEATKEENHVVDVSERQDISQEPTGAEVIEPEVAETVSTEPEASREEPESLPVVPPTMEPAEELASPADEKPSEDMLPESAPESLPFVPPVVEPEEELAPPTDEKPSDDMLPESAPADDAVSPVTESAETQQAESEVKSEESHSMESEPHTEEMTASLGASPSEETAPAVLPEEAVEQEDDACGEGRKESADEGRDEFKQVESDSEPEAEEKPAAQPLETSHDVDKIEEAGKPVTPEPESSPMIVEFDPLSQDENASPEPPVDVSPAGEEMRQPSPVETPVEQAVSEQVDPADQTDAQIGQIDHTPKDEDKEQDSITEDVANGNKETQRDETKVDEAEPCAPVQIKADVEGALLDLDLGEDIDDDSLAEISQPQKSHDDYPREQPDLLSDMAGEPSAFQMDSSQELPPLECGTTTNPFFGVLDSDQMANAALDEPANIPQSNGQSYKTDDEFRLPSPNQAQELERDSLERDDPSSSFDPLKDWGQPMGLPAPEDGKLPKAARKTEGASGDAVNGAKKPGATRTAGKSAASTGARRATGDAKKPAAAADAKKTATARSGVPPARRSATARPPKEEAAPKKPASGTATKRPASSGRPGSGPTSAAQAASKTATSKAPAAKRASSGTARAAGTPKAAAPKPVTPFYVDLTYVPNHGDANYVDVDFFRRIRARYYVLSALNPNPAILNSFLEAKETWEDADAEVTIIPTYDTEVLRHWMALHREKLGQLKVDIAPSASRCTIQLQDHETSCAAYRLEF